MSLPTPKPSRCVLPPCLGRRVPGLFLALMMAGLLVDAGCGEKPPNIILILADDMGWDIAALGHPHVKTPHLDRLAEEGRVFENYYVASPVCSPTRVSFMTGVHPSRFGIHDYINSDMRANWRRNIPNFLDPNIVTVADVVKRAGYRTGHFGKWHLRSGAAPSQKDYGIDHHRSTWLLTNHFRTYSSSSCVEEALRFLDQRGEQPFYLNLWFFHMHRPVVASLDQKRVYDGETFPPSDFVSHMRDYSELMTDPEERFLAYNAVVTSMDAAVGRLLSFLDEQGLTDDTLILFTSDNGPEDFRLGLSAVPGAGSSGRFRGRKRSIYEGGIRMPCIARWPGRIPAGTLDSTSVMSSLDWLPTVASLAGEETPPHTDGEDMLEVLKGTPGVRERPLIWEFRNEAVGEINDAPRFAIRDGRWKLLWEEARDGEGGEQIPAQLELYDLEADPEERTNLAGTEPVLEAGLQARLEEFKASLEGRPVVITEQPEVEMLVDPGGEVNLRVAAVGTPPPAYRWFRNGVPLQDGPRVEGAASHLLVVSDLVLEDTGSYLCLASNGRSGLRSGATRLQVQEAPSVTRQPTPRFLWEGGVASYSVGVRASGPVSYQWYQGTVALQDGGGVSGAQSANLRLEDLDAPMIHGGAEGYFCRITNLVGAVQSESAPLMVMEAGSADFDAWIAFYSEGAIRTGSFVADLDSDGWTDFLEFAGGSDPTSAHERPAFEVRGNAGGLEVSYERWRGGAERGFGGYETLALRYDLEVLKGQQWVRLRELLALDRVETSEEGTSERAYYRSLLPGHRGALFLRLRVTQR
ncbi:MAG: sulfatase-like hydrolase/transferase [Roseibacillus sp.]|nr:sulfatase-like hydrolase/transferase [Roseibacillus sp.]